MKENFLRFNLPDFAQRDFIVDEQTRARVELIKKFLHNEPIDNKKRWALYIWGLPGIGKTHLAVHGLKHFVSHISPWALFFPFHAFMRKIKMLFGQDAESNNFIDNVLNCELLVLDDIGASRMTDFPLQMFQEIIDDRYNHSRKTILTSNQSGEDFKKDFGDRLYSRIFESGKEIECTQTSYNRLTC